MAETMRDLGELGLLRDLAPILRAHTEGFPLGTGDDVAITDGIPFRRIVWTIDTMIEGVHFRWWDDPRVSAADHARKLVASNMSDLASKGASPVYTMISLGVPPEAEAGRVREFYRGLDESIRQYGALLIGGDTVRAPQWTLTLVAIGELSTSTRIAARDRARAGMYVYTTGWPGEAAAGIELLERGIRTQSPDLDILVRRAVAPEARLALGAALAERIYDLSMMDISDGVAKDAARIAEASGVGIELIEAALPLSPRLYEAQQHGTSDPLHLALHGGEDYELLFCTSFGPQDIAAMDDVAGVPITPIGRVVEGEGVWLLRRDGTRARLQQEGFEHFQ